MPISVPNENHRGVLYADELRHADHAEDLGDEGTGSGAKPVVTGMG